MNMCDCLLPVASIACARARQSGDDAYHSATIALGKRHERTTTSTAQQAKQTYNAVSQTAYGNRKRDVGIEDAGRDPSAAVPLPQHTPTVG